MPATPSRIGFVQSEFRRATSVTASVQTRYGALARQSDDPVVTFFDNVADAQIVADARQALMSAERRRFRVGVSTVEEALALSYIGAVPKGRYVDSERNANLPVLVSEITVDLSRLNAAFTVWG